MQSNYEDVIELHKKFDFAPTKLPTLLCKKELQDRLNFMREELTEFEEGCFFENLTECFDALLDIVYVAMGTAYMMNLPWQKGWNEVHKTNMLKERMLEKDGDSKTGRNLKYDLKKPKNWKRPDLATIIKKHEKQLKEIQNEKS